MVEHGEFAPDPSELSVEAMQEALFEYGWKHTVSEGGTEHFTRAYARVNPALQGDEWHDVIGRLPSVIDERAPYLRRGLGIEPAGRETELEIEMSGKKGERDSVTKIFITDSYLRECGFEEIDEEMLSVWSKLKGEPGAPIIGSKAYYDQDPRSAELRTLSLQAIEHYRRVIVSEGAEGRSMEALLELNKKLAELAIEPKMHVGAPQVEFANPVVRAEWVAGLIRSALGQGYGFSANARAVIQEHNLLTSDEEVPMAVVDLNSPAGSAASALMNLDALANHLDPEPEED